MPQKNITTEKEIAKQIKNIRLQEKAINKQEDQILGEIKGLEIELAQILKKETTIESKIEEIEELEKITPSEKRSQIEKKRWKKDAERREIEKAKWSIQEKIEKVEEKIKLIELKYQELLEKKKKFGKAEQEIFQRNKDKELAQEKIRLENKIFPLASKEKTIEKKHEELLKKKRELQAEQARVLKEEAVAEEIVRAVSAKEKTISDPKDKREIEKQRWQVEDNRKSLEKSKWELEKKQKRLSIELKRTKEKRQKTLDKKTSLKQRIKQINLILGKTLKTPLLKTPTLKKPEIPLKETPLKETPLKKVPLKTSPLKTFPLKTPPLKKSEQLSEQEKQKLQILFDLAVKYYNKKEMDRAGELFLEIKKRAEKPEKKPGFLARLFNKFPIYIKADKHLEIIKRTKKESPAKPALVKTSALEKEKEQESAKKELIKKIKEKQEQQQREELKKHREELRKQYEEELRKQRQELIEQHKKELEQKKLETEERAQKIVQSREIIKEKYIPYMPRGLAKPPELSSQLETEQEKLKKQHKKELSKQAEELMGQRKKELIQQEEKIIRIQHEELRKEDLDRKKVEQGIKPKKLELTEKQKRKKREDLAIRRKAIQMEVERIEQEELKRKEMEQTKQEQIIRREKEQAERHKRTEILGKQGKEKEAIKDTWEKLTKEKVLSKQEIQAREQKEKELLPVFELAVKHYKEKEFKRAEKLFTEVKKQAVEPEKEPRFLSKLLNKLPLYIKSEKYLEKIEKQKLAEEKKIVRMARRRDKKETKEKKKEKKQALFPQKEEWKKQPLGRRASDFFRGRITFYHPIISIDISDHSIEILYLSKQKSILAYGRTIIEQGIVRDGEIIKQKALTKALRLTVQRAGFQPFDPRKGPYLRAIVSLPEFKTYIQTFTFNSRDNLFEKVKQEIEKTIPFPINDLYWSYIESWDGNSSKIKVLCAAVLKDVVNNQIHFFKASGINPIIFDIEATSLGRALLSQELKQSTIILDIGARTTNLNIFDKNGFIGLSATIPYAGLDFAAKIADELDISKQKAETIMGEKGFKKQDNPFLLILEQEAEKIVKEVQQSINYYQGKFGKDAEKIKKIILAGGLSLVPGIDSFFQKHFKEIKVEMGNPLEKIKRKGGMRKDMAILYSNAIGLALRNVAKDPVKHGINLLPEEIKSK